MMRAKWPEDYDRKPKLTLAGGTATRKLCEPTPGNVIDFKPLNRGYTKLKTVSIVLADAMDLSTEDRATLARYLTTLATAEIELDSDSVRAASGAELRKMMG